jgi:hypothetical protein
MMDTLQSMLWLADLVIVPAIESIKQKRALKQQMEAQLGRKVADQELLSITSWMKRAEYAQTSN